MIYSNSDINNPAFYAMIDVNADTLSPVVEVQRLKLSANSSEINKVTLGSEVANTNLYSLSSTNEIPIINQESQATNLYIKILPSNVTPEAFIEVYPPMDSWFNRKKAPIITNKSDSLYEFSLTNDKLKFCDWKSLIGYKNGDGYIRNNVELTIDTKVLNIKGYGFPIEVDYKIYFDDVEYYANTTSSIGEINANVEFDIDYGESVISIKTEKPISGKTRYFAKALFNKSGKYLNSPSVGGFYYEYDESFDEFKPLTQVFEVNNDLFISKLKLFGKFDDTLAIQSNSVVNVRICETEAGKPVGNILDYSSKTVNVSDILKSGLEESIEFKFDFPIFLAKHVKYAIQVYSNMSSISLAAYNGDSSKDTNVGGLYYPCNGINVNRNSNKEQFLKMVLYKHEFNVTEKTIPFTISTDNTFEYICGSTTDFIPYGTSLTYKLNNIPVPMGLYGTPDINNLHSPISNSSPINVTFNSDTTELSPVLSDDGLNIFGINYKINNLELHSSDFTLNSGLPETLTYPISVTFDHIDGEEGNSGSGKIYENGSIIIEGSGSGFISSPKIISNYDKDYSSSFTFKSELGNDIGNAMCRYISKVMYLSDISNKLTITINAYRPIYTNIYVLYRACREGEDTAEYSWNLMYNVNKINYTKLNNTLDYTFTLDQDQTKVLSNTFKKYQIKVLLTTSDRSNMPKIYNITPAITS